MFRESHFYPGNNCVKADDDPAIYRTLEASYYYRSKWYKIFFFFCLEGVSSIKLILKLNQLFPFPPPPLPKQNGIF